MASLTQAEATARAATITVAAYRVDLDLTTGDETFRSVTTIEFTACPGGATFLDLKPEAVRSIVLNGRPLDLVLADGRLPLTGLAETNTLVVDADMAYSNQCEGLHRFVDPADGAVYVYAFAYIDNAPRVFACFDQPDLKAPYTFTLTTGPGLRVLGNADATEVAPGRWELGPTSPQPPYLTTVLVGPYAEFHRDHHGVRLGLHCRASRAADLAGDVDEIFEITGQCLDFYQDLFGVAYPYPKLDQAFVPEFAVLSLDHPACILIRELYLFGSAVPASERETRAVVVAHGLSLMWMAGLVTNRWWNDLWFGEAFADYIGHRATGEVTRFPGPLTTFAVRRKAEAYVADQRPSTHPVALSSQDVQSALLDLDRISYFKGSSVLRQLATTVGPSSLRLGLRTYFERHAYGNGSFAEFVGTLSEAIGTDMTGWVDAWFRQPGMTTLRPEITIVDGRITAAVLHQEGGVPRPHTLHIGLYSALGHETVEVRVSGVKCSLPELIGRAAPEFILVNEDDLTYAKVWLDDRSRAALPEWLPRLSPLNRAMVWCGLLMAVRDGALPADSYVDLAVRMLGEEPDLSILVEVLEHLRDEVVGRYVPPSSRRASTDRLAGALRQRLATMPAGDERQVALARGLVEFSSDAAELRSWLSGRAPDGLTVDEDLGWRIRYRLSVLGSFTAAEIEAALAAAPSAHAEQMAAKAGAAIPDPSLKAATWTTVMTGAEMSNYLRWALAEGFWQPDQVELTRPYEERFFAEIGDVARTQGDIALGQLVRFFYPRFAAGSETLRHSEKLMSSSDVSVALRRKVADAMDDLRRVVAVRES